MSLILTNLSDSTFYTFPATFDLHDWQDREFSARSKLLARFGVSGGHEISDRAIQPRKVRVKGAYHAASQAALKTFMDGLLEGLHHNGEEYRFSWESGQYIGVSHVSRFRQKRFKEGLAYKSVEIDIEFTCPDPHWYSTTDDSVSPVSITTSPKDITFNSYGNVPSPLKIQCDPTATWADFTIENVTDSNNLVRYTDPSFGNGDQLIIDAREGTAKRDGSNTVRYMKGAFLRVLPGSNTIRYTGPTGGNITLSAPKRFL